MHLHFAQLNISYFLFCISSYINNILIIYKKYTNFGKRKTPLKEFQKSYVTFSNSSLFLNTKYFVKKTLPVATVLKLNIKVYSFS